VSHLAFLDAPGRNRKSDGMNIKTDIGVETPGVNLIGLFGAIVLDILDLNSSSSPSQVSNLSLHPYIDL
jgi:hypothetical protein